jgi:hypothetical protein
MRISWEYTWNFHVHNGSIFLVKSGDGFLLIFGPRPILGDERVGEMEMIN